MCIVELLIPWKGFVSCFILNKLTALKSNRLCSCLCFWSTEIWLLHAAFDRWLCFRLWVVGCLGCGLGFVLLHMHVFCDPGQRGASSQGHALLVENHQNTKAGPNHTSRLMASAATGAMESSLAKGNQVAEPRVPGERECVLLPVEGRQK